MQSLIDDKQAIHRAKTAKRLLFQQAHHGASATELRVAALVSVQYPAVAGPVIFKEQAFEIIARVRKRIAAEEISADSIKDYEKKAQHLRSMMDAGEEPCEAMRWIQALDRYAARAGSFRANG